MTLTAKTVYLEENQQIALNELFSSLVDSKYLTDEQNVALTSLKNQLNQE